MTSVALSTAGFPRLRTRVTARWAPIYLEPIAGSDERLVIAVAVVSDSLFHVERANALDRLDCLYGDQGAIVRFSASVIAEQLNHDLASRGIEAVTDYDPPLSGAYIGSVRNAEGASIEAIGRAWMSAVSSLYDREAAAASRDPDVLAAAADVAAGVGVIDKLPKQVLDAVSEEAPELAKNFRADLRGAPRKRKSFDVTIDYQSTDLVVNFGAIRAGEFAQSARLLQSRLWHLRVDRDNDRLLGRPYELLVLRPDYNDPLYSDVQIRHIQEAEQALEEQANGEELRFEALTSVEQIGTRVIEQSSLRVVR